MTICKQKMNSYLHNMKPEKSYRIWFSQRNGSTLLCKGLEQTGIAGIPGEYFNVMESETLCEKFGVQTYDALRKRIWALGTSSNGVFGIKHSMHTSRYRRIFDELKKLKGIDIDTIVPEEELIIDIFPNCKHIYLTRRNKIRQAVSWWKAIKDNVWHLDATQHYSEEEEFYDKNYDFAALSHLFKEATLRECAMQAYFSKNKIQPMTLVYEDMVEDLNHTIHLIIDYLEIEHDELHIQEKFYKKTANSNSEKWVQKFREDLQKDMGDKIW